MCYALFEPNPFEDNEFQEMEKVVKNMVKYQYYPKMQTNVTAQLKCFVKLPMKIAKLEKRYKTNWFTWYTWNDVRIIAVLKLCTSVFYGNFWMIHGVHRPLVIQMIMESYIPTKNVYKICAAKFMSRVWYYASVVDYNADGTTILFHISFWNKADTGVWDICAINEELLNYLKVLFKFALDNALTLVGDVFRSTERSEHVQEKIN